MRSVQDVLYNWLTIKIVADARPFDEAAQETYTLFHNMLYEDHQLCNVKVEKKDDMYIVTYEKGKEKKFTRFPLELIDCFLEQIEREPEKYK